MADHKAFDRIVARTARRLLRELDRVVAELPKEWAPQTAIECALIELKRHDPALHTIMMSAAADHLYMIESHSRPTVPVQNASGDTLH